MPRKEHRRLRSLLPRPMLRQILLDQQGEPPVVAQERGVEVDAIGGIGNAHRRARVRHEPFVGHAQRPREIGVEERGRRVFADLFERAQVLLVQEVRAGNMFLYDRPTRAYVVRWASGLKLPIATPTSRTSPGFQLLAMPAAGGKHVAGMECSMSIDVFSMALRNPCGPSVIIYEVLLLSPFKCHASAPEVSAALFSSDSSCAGVVWCGDAWGIRLLSCASGRGSYVHMRGIA